MASTTGRIAMFAALALALMLATSLALFAPARALALPSAVTLQSDSNGNITIATVESAISPAHTDYWFYGLSKLTRLDVSKMDTSPTTSMAHMFDGCSSLEDLRIGNFNTKSCTDLSGMFTNMPSLKRVTLGTGFDFKGNGITDSSKWAILPTQRDSDGKELKWVNATAITPSQYVNNGVTAEELRDNYRKSGQAKYAAGTYVLLEASLTSTYAVTYQAGPQEGAGGNPPASAAYTFGTKFTVPGVTFTRPGYTAIGWVEVTYADDGAGGVTRTEGARHAGGSQMTATRNVTLEPVWQALGVSCTIPTSMPLALETDGSVVGPDNGTLAISNTGNKSALGVTGIKVSERDTDVVRLVTRLVKLGSMTLFVTPGTGVPISLGAYVSSDYQVPEEPEDWVISASERLFLNNIYGRLYGVKVASDPLDIGTVGWQVGLPEPATVSFDANGGEGLEAAPMASQAVTPGVSFCTPGCTFSAPAGTTFSGWNTKADGTGSSYAIGASVSVLGDTTFYAQWK